MKKRAGSSSLLMRYIAWNLCFVLIPVILLISLYTQKTRDHLIREMEAGNLSLLRQTAMKVDADISAFIAAATKLSSDIQVTPYLLRSNTYEGVDALKRLGIYSTQLGFVDDLMLYIRGDDTLYSGRGVTSLDRMFEQIYETDGGWSRQEFITLIGEGTELAFSPPGQTLKRSESHQRYTVIVYPWSRSGSTPFGTVVGLINQSYWHGLISGLQTANVENAMILTTDGQVIGRQSAAADKGYTDLEFPLEEGRHTASKNGETVSFLVTRSDVMGCYFVSSFSHNSVSVGLFSFDSPVLAFLFALLAACLFFGVFMAYRNWLPIYRLCERMGAKDCGAKRRNELNALTMGMETLLTEQADLDRQRIENQSLVQQGLLAQLLDASTPVDADLIDRLKMSGVVLDGPAYCVLAASMQNLNTAKRIDLLQACADRDVYAIDMIYKNYVALLFSDERETAAATAEKLIGELRASIDGALCFGMAAPAESLMNVNESMAQAVMALETLLVTAKSGERAQPIVRYDQLRQGCDESIFEGELLALRMLEQGIRQNNRLLCEQSIAELDEMLRRISTSDDLITVHFMTDTIALKLLGIARECRVDQIEERIRGLIHYEGLEEFLCGVHSLCELTSETFARHNACSGRLTYLAVSKYLDEHVYDQAMSLEKLADQFNLSVQYMSRFFREHAGVTFMDHVTQRRMEKAEELLTTTNEPVRDIVEQIGYINSASFTRKFTEIYGISPGRYRKMHIRTHALEEIS